MEPSVVSPDGNIKAVLFDFGGVLAEEGFREGLKAIGRGNGLDPGTFFQSAGEAAYETGYVIGATDEHAYWEAVRKKTGVKRSDAELRQELLQRFAVRPWMIEIVRRVRNQGRDVSILSDQTNWLDELNEQYDFFKEFDQIFNSYHLGKGKRDPTLFSDIARRLRVQPSEIVFVDDNEGHIERARSRGLHGILFIDGARLVTDLERFGLLR